jgi:SAM-dependent methyltransferase
MDRKRIDQFLDRFIGLAAGATTIALLAVADRTGLTAHLGPEPATSDDIADRAGLDRRYVAEILAGLAAAGVVDLGPDGGYYSLPEEHALFLVDASSPYHLAGWLDVVPALYAVIDDVANGVSHGGGVRAEVFPPNAERGLDRLNSPSQRVFLAKRWLPGVPGLVESLDTGIRVADVGCGSGTAVITMATEYPASRFTGFDVSDTALAVARERGGDLPNLDFARVGAGEIPTDPPFDLITAFDVIHDLADPLGGLRRIREALAPDGVFLMMEPNASSDVADNLDADGALLYGVSTLYCMTQSLALGGAGLGAAWGRERANRLAAEAGFGTFEHLESISNRFSAFYLLRR